MILKRLIVIFNQIWNQFVNIACLKDLFSTRYLKSDKIYLWITIIDNVQNV